MGIHTLNKRLVKVGHMGIKDVSPQVNRLVDLREFCVILFGQILSGDGI